MGGGAALMVVTNTGLADSKLAPFPGSALERGLLVSGVFRRQYPGADSHALKRLTGSRRVLLKSLSLVRSGGCVIPFLLRTHGIRPA